MRTPLLTRPLVLLVLTVLLVLGTGGPARPVSSPSWWDPAPSREGDWPLNPRPSIARGFEPPASLWGAGHRGVDLVGRAGQQVHTSLGGTVTFAGPLAGRGVVVVDHGALRTTYEPVSATVSVGEVVERGAVVGTLQRARSHCLPRSCLHWGLLRGREYLNPLVLVGGGPLRLLPLTPASPATPGLSPGLSLYLYLLGSTPAGGRAGRPGAASRW